MSDVLSQSEIDALLQALSTGEVDVTEIKEETKEKKVKKYDFRRPDKFAKDQLRTLQIIHENYARLLNTFLSGYLRSLTHVDVLTVEQLTYYEFSNSISNPAILGIVDFTPLSGQIIVDITTDIGFVMIDRILGGYGSVLDETRSFTEIEITLLKKIMKQIVKILKEPWDNVIKIEPTLEKVETNSQFAQIVSPNETISLITLNVRIGDVEGMINICIPHMVIEPILQNLSTKFWFATLDKKRTAEDEQMLANRVEKTQVDLKAEIGSTYITVSDFLDLQIGDVIQLDSLTSDEATIFVGNEMKFKGRPGVKKKNIAVQISNVIKKGEE